MLESPDSTWKEKSYTSQEAVQHFVDAISRADGELIPLPGVRSKLDEPLFISARIGRTDFWGDRVDAILLIDVFAERNGDFEPVGHYDWVIKDQSALGNKNRHGHLEQPQEAHRKAVRKWSTGEAFKVDETTFFNYAMQHGGMRGMTELRQAGVITDESQWQERIYQRLNVGEHRVGIGSLMLVASACVLRSWGINELEVGSLSPSARGVWAKFGRTDGSPINVQRILVHPVAVSTAESFLRNSET